MLKSLDINPEYVDKRKFESGNKENILNQHFYTDVKSLAEYKSFVLKNKKNKYLKKYWYKFKVGNYEINVPFERMEHIINNHNLTDEQLESIEKSNFVFEEVLANTNNLGQYQGIESKGKTKINGNPAGISVEIDRQGTIYLTTAFFDTEKNIDYVWLEKNPANIHTEKTVETVGRGNINITQIKDFVKKYFEKERLEQTAYHGTPHRFDEFSTENIGTGEGVQAHGWGLYFAEDRDVSESYREKLADEADIIIDGVKATQEEDAFLRKWFDMIDEPEYIKKRIKRNINHNEDFIRAIKKNVVAEKGVIEKVKQNEGKKIKDITFSEEENSFVEGFIEREKVSSNTEPTPEKLVVEMEQILDRDASTIEEVERETEILKNFNNKKIEFKNKGQLFQVEIPENDVLLDEDKTFNEQPKNVQEVLNELIKDNMYRIEKSQLKGHEGEYKLIKGHEVIDIYDDIEEAKRALKENNDTVENRLGKIKQANGRQIYNIISDYLGPFKSDRDTSLLLNEYGIKGITYDGRQDGRCFVIFDDKAVKILEKFYQESKAKIDESFFKPDNTEQEIKEYQRQFDVSIKDVATYDNEQFNKMLKFKICSLPKIYRYLIDKAQKGDVKMTRWAMLKDLHYIPYEHEHFVKEGTLKNLPYLLADPKAVFEDGDGGYVVLLDDKDKKGFNVVADISLKQNENGYHLITSVYGKNTNYDNFVETAVKEGRVIYERNKNDLQNSLGRYSAIVGSVSRTNSVLHKEDIVNDILNKRILLQDNLFVNRENGANKIVRGFIIGDEIHITPASDISTYIHEMGHYWLRDLQNYILSGNATQEAIKDWNVLKKWLNITDDTKHLTTEQQELYTSGLETYMMEGKAPNIELRDIFRKIADLMKYIYKKLIFNKVELSQDVHDYFDRLFATEQEIADNLASMEDDVNNFIQKQTDKMRKEYEKVKNEANFIVKLLKIKSREFFYSLLFLYILFNNKN